MNKLHASWFAEISKFWKNAGKINFKGIEQ